MEKIKLELGNRYPIICATSLAYREEASRYRDFYSIFDKPFPSEIKNDHMCRFFAIRGANFFCYPLRDSSDTCRIGIAKTMSLITSIQNLRALMQCKISLKELLCRSIMVASGLQVKNVHEVADFIDKHLNYALHMRRVTEEGYYIYEAFPEQAYE